MGKQSGKLVRPRAERRHVGDDALCVEGCSFREAWLDDPCGRDLQCLPP